MSHLLPPTRQPAEGMGMAVAERTIFRESDEKDWALVADRVATGNVSLVPPDKLAENEFEDLRAAIACGAFLTSGRHLQHGDIHQKQRNLELFSNCSTAISSFLLFYLLLNGSGVGRSYDDSLMLVDWANAPDLLVVLDSEHPDYPRNEEEKKEYLLSFWPNKNVIANAWDYLFTGVIFSEVPNSLNQLVHKVEDSREGWAAAMELYETMAFQRDKRTLILDFSNVRKYGSPIAGMQNRPASGPLSVMRAFLNIREKVVSKAKRGLLPRWLQAMHVDHFLSEEVQVGGARRAARMSTKDWRDPEILDFISIKSKGGLWTSNNSVMVDATFWRDAYVHGTRAREIFEAVTAHAYSNGEPGFINGDQLDDAKRHLDRNRPLDFVPGSKKFQVTAGKQLMLAAVSATHYTRFATITNPCIVGETEILTEAGWKPVTDLLGEPFVAVVDGVPYAASGFWCSGVRPIMELRTNAGHKVRLTMDHEVLTLEGWKPAGMLAFGDELKLPDLGKTTVVSVLPAGEAPVYDCQVKDAHCVNGNGLFLHNCGEIPLHVRGGYCVIGDFAPLLACPIDFTAFPAGEFPADICRCWDLNVMEVVALGVRFLMRVNRMNNLYWQEVDLTNRIGIGPTGLHEWAWMRFGLSFYDLLDEEKSKEFWALLRKLSHLAKAEAAAYAKQLNVRVPTTVTTCKPAGTTSKVFGLSEGAHLPARRRYLRWVQFRGVKLPDGQWESTSDMLLPYYESKGYPIRQLDSFPGMSIVGFPTETLFCRLGIDSRFVTASEASPDEQYQWLRLLEQAWLGETQGNQISYTLKFFTEKNTLQDFRKVILEHQPHVRCCTILPVKEDSTLTYEYLPEEDITEDYYKELTQKIKRKALEVIDIEALRCENGVCPL